MYRDNPIIRIANALTSVSIDDFEDRLRLQKIGFLAQEIGANTGFAFNWYRKGPYSPSLTRMFYAADELGMLRLSRVELNRSESAVAKALKELLGDGIENPRALELIASVWYLLPKRSISKKEIEQVLEVLVEQKPQFKKEELREAMRSVLDFREKWRTNQSS
jgi:uncharacterized protein YwgA